MKKQWLTAALNRAVRTMAQTASGLIGTAVILEAVDWRTVVSASLMAGLASMLTSLATKLPEVEDVE